MRMAERFWLLGMAVAGFALHGAPELVLEPGVREREQKPETWSVTVDQADPAAAQAAAKGLSSRLYGSGGRDLSQPLILHVRRQNPGVFAIHVHLASIGGAIVQVDVNNQPAGQLEWPAAGATHQVNQVYWTALPAGESTIRLRARHGVMVVQSYQFAESAEALESTPPALPLPKPAPARTKVDGYRGIWFTLGQFYAPGEGGEPYSKTSRTPVFPYGDKYSGGLGTYTCSHSPLAIYAPAVNRTFFVYGGTTAADQRHLLCMASYYDHATNRVPRPTIVYDKMGVNDPHDNPSLALDEKGYLWIFVSGRGRARPGFKFRSTEPYSVDAFEQITEEEMTYPQPHWIPGHGFLHLFTKYTGVRELYFETSPDGVTWSEDAKLAGIREPGKNRGGHYQVTARAGTCVGTFFNRHPDGNVDRRTDLYYVQTRDAGKTWTTVDGQPLALPLESMDTPALVTDYAAQSRNVYTCDMAFTADGRPAVLYVTSRGHEPGPPNDPREWRVTRWTGTEWRTTVITQTDHNYDMGSLYIEDGEWRVIAPTETGPQPYQGGGEMALWISRDEGETWTLQQRITQNSAANQNYARRPVDARDPFYAFWADGDPTRLSISHLYFTDREGKRVWRLPYEMTEDTAEPELVTQP
jgi:hypothetical protein